MTVEPRVLTPAEAMHEVAAWATRRPYWQQVALSRLQSSVPVADGDVVDLADLCLEAVRQPDWISPTDAGDEESGDPAAGPSTVPAPVVALRWLSGVADVNALRPGEKLKFEAAGLTLIFGHNGTGKSGYSRILKDACKARAADGKILANVYSGSPSGVPRATIRYTVDGEIHDYQWRLGNPCNSHLDEISVFDAACAIGHVEARSGPSYTPHAIRLLQRLAGVCQRVESELRQRRAALQEAQRASMSAPSCKPGTTVAQLLAGLSHQSEIQKANELANVTAADQARAAELRRQLADDPSTAAATLKNRTDRLDGMVREVRAYIVAVNDESLAAIHGTVCDARTKREAAQAAATTLFSSAPLPAVGSRTWEALWEAARSYSRSEAYPTEPFPNVAEGARCVLCQQELGVAARERLSGFEAYVQAETAQAAETAEGLAADALSRLERAPLSSGRILEVTTAIREEWARQDLAEAVTAMVDAANSRSSEALAKLRDGAEPRVGTLTTSPLDELDRLVREARERIAGLQASAESAERVALETEADELEARIWLAEVLADVEAEIDRLAQLYHIDSALRETVTTAISRKSSSLADNLLTANLCERFSEELGTLGLRGVSAEFRRADSERGVPRFEIQLLNAMTNTPVGEVLSEGEHRCVALAAFMAELAAADAKSAIIFDDPVSSLDHEYRQAVAQRLVEEARTRQVIVFTHDLVFLTELGAAAHTLRIAHTYRSIDRTETATGLCSNDVPIRYLPVLDGVDNLRDYVGKVRCAYDRRGWSAWCGPSESCLQQLRKLWEAAVEEVIAPVYRRLSYKMDTKGLAKVSVITDDDCRIMRDGYRWCNPEMHRQAACTVGPPATPDEVLDRLATLRQWVVDILARQEAAAS